MGLQNPVPRGVVSAVFGIVVFAAFCGSARAQATLDVVRTFPATAAVPMQPRIVTQAPDGTIYGVGGRDVSTVQTVFKLTPDGVLTTLHSFNVGEFIDALILGPDGQLYGSTASRMSNYPPDQLTYGIVFSLSPAGDFAKLAGVGIANDVDWLSMGPDGYLYASEYGCFVTCGTYRISPSGGGISKVSNYIWNMTVGSDGALYGGGCSYVYRVALDGSVIDLGSTSACSNNFFPTREVLVAASDGNLYGVNGTVMFKATPGPTGVVSVLHTFNASTDPCPIGIAQGADGYFYGWSGQQLIRLATDGTETPAYTFADGEVVQWLAPGATGVIVAFTSSNGSPVGGVFSFAGGTYSLLHALTNPGGTPRGGLVQTNDGTLLGATGGGPGVIYQITPAGTFSIVHSFAGGADGEAPNFFSLAPDGALIGVSTYAPSLNGAGEIVRVAPDGTATVMSSTSTFSGAPYPNSAPLQAADGSIYGTTAVYGLQHYGPQPGVAYHWTASGGLSGLHSLWYATGLVQAADGNFYGLQSGPAQLFRMTSTGTFTPLHTFTTAEGSYATDTITVGGDGNLYGVMATGGANNKGTLFRATLDGTVTVLHAFTVTEGAPVGPVLVAPDGTLFGAVQVSGKFGSVYALSPSAGFRIIYQFTGGADGGNPSGPLQLGPDGRLYGISAGSGNITDISGVVYRLHAAPIVTAAPASHLGAIAGQPVTLSAAAIAVGASTVQWQVTTDNGATFAPIPGATTTTLILMPTTAMNGYRYRAVFTNADGSAASAVAILTVRPVGARTVAADVDGDARADLVIYHRDTGTFSSLTSSSGYDPTVPSTQQWGSDTLGDVPFLADMDGDGIADYVVWRASTGTWFWLTSSSNYDWGFAHAVQWGNAALGDVPLVADLDGDGRGDLIVWRASTGTWFWLPSSSGYAYTASQQKQFGNVALGDQPMLGDLDGDGRADLIVWRASTGTWFALLSSASYDYASAFVLQWGNADLGDVPLVADLDGDLRADLAIWRASTGTWYWLSSSSNFAYGAARSVQWGNAALGDVPLLPDLDGDGRADLTVWRASTGTWFWLPSSSGYPYGSARTVAWGAPNSHDVPMSR